MRLVPVLLAGIVLAAAPAVPPAEAQVTVNPGALDALPKPAPVHRAAPRRATHPAPAHNVHPAPAAQAPAKPATPAATAKPVIPPTPPAILAIPPAVAVPMLHPPPPPPVPVANDAPGAASAIGSGVRITFGDERFEFNPATEAALRAFAHAVADKTDTPISIFAYAAGSPDDPSTPRRLSLERALATRAVLMDEGIPSPRIYPRALGPAGGAVAPDRVDVVTGTQVPPPPPDGPAG